MASTSASGSGMTRAPLRWPATRRKPPPPSPPSPSSSNEHSEASYSDVPCQGGDCQLRAKRVRIGSAEVQQDASLSASAAPAPASSSVEHVEASEEAEAPLAALTAATMAERASAMFILDATGPVASGMPKVADKATMELVSLAFGAVGKLCDQHGKALTQAYGNFDRVVGLSWLVADALGCPLLTRDAAYTIGIKLRKLPGELKADQLAARKVASRAFSKLAADDPKRQELKQAAADEEARLLRVEIDLELPSAEPQPRASSTGKRKSAAPPPPNSLTARQAAAADAILAAQKAVSRAERALESAGKAVDAHERHVSRLWSRVELLSELPRRTFKQLQQTSRCMRTHNKAQNTLHVMELRQRDAMIAYLEAQLELRDAWMDEKDLDMEQYMAEMDAVYASGSEA